MISINTQMPAHPAHARTRGALFSSAMIFKKAHMEHKYKKLVLGWHFPVPDPELQSQWCKSKVCALILSNELHFDEAVVTVSCKGADPERCSAFPEWCRTV